MAAEIDTLGGGDADIDLEGRWASKRLAWWVRSESQVRRGL